MKDLVAREFVGQLFVPNPSKIRPGKKDVTYRLADSAKVQDFLEEDVCNLVTFQEKLEKVIFQWNAAIFGLDDPPLIQCNYRGAQRLVSIGGRHRGGRRPPPPPSSTKRKMQNLRRSRERLAQHGDVLEESRAIAARASAEAKKKKKDSRRMLFGDEEVDDDSSGDETSNGSDKDSYSDEGDTRPVNRYQRPSSAGSGEKKRKKSRLVEALEDEGRIDDLQLSELPDSPPKKKKSNPNEWDTKPDKGTWDTRGNKVTLQQAARKLILLLHVFMHSFRYLRQ